MPFDLFGPVGKVVHDTAKQAIDSEIPKKTAGVVNTFVDSIFGIAEDALKKVVEITEETPPATPGGGT